MKNPKSHRDPRRRLWLDQKRRLMDDQDGKCFYCGVVMHHRGTHPDDLNTDPLWACTDHRVPWSIGGLTDLENCVMACRSCNSKKGCNVA